MKQNGWKENASQNNIITIVQDLACFMDVMIVKVGLLLGQVAVHENYSTSRNPYTYE